MGMNKGEVVQVIGPVVDIRFEPEQLPDLLTAIQITGEVEGNQIDLTLEAAQHLGIILCAALPWLPQTVCSVDGAVDLEGPITVPVGRNIRTSL